MDTSEQYIKMCAKAVDIQKVRVLANGDYEVRLKHGRGQVEVHHHREITAHYRPSKIIWLPRQDQLQAMIGDYILCLNLLGSCTSGEFEDGDKWENFHAFDDYASMEQLWLAFVMFELYEKAWEDGEWKS